MARPDSGGHSNIPINGSKSSLTRNDMGLYTIIGKTNRDATGKPLGQDNGVDNQENEENWIAES